MRERARYEAELAVKEFNTFEPAVQITNKGANGTTCMRLQYCNFQLITRALSFFACLKWLKGEFFQRVVYKKRIILNGLYSI